MDDDQARHGGKKASMQIKRIGNIDPMQPIQTFGFRSSKFMWQNYLLFLFNSRDKLLKFLYW